MAKRDTKQLVWRMSERERALIQDLWAPHTGRTQVEAMDLLGEIVASLDWSEIDRSFAIKLKMPVEVHDVVKSRSKGASGATALSVLLTAAARLAEQDRRRAAIAPGSVANASDRRIGKRVAARSS